MRYGTGDMTWRMSFACWITKAADYCFSTATAVTTTRPSFVFNRTLPLTFDIASSGISVSEWH
jgi:hypothetical protein